MSADTLVYPLANGAVLHDKYTILNVLNAGGFGITYLALDNAHSRYVVIKECMPAAYAARDQHTGFVHPHSEELRHSFELSVANSKQEADVLADLHHPGIVELFDRFDANGTTYYVMENIHGQTLHDMKTARAISGQNMTPEQISTLLFNLLDILEYLHSHDVYHCDIKPGNIFVQPGGQPKLIDFGAVRTKTLQHQGLVQVTPGYTPPEFYPGRRSEIGPWCDIYGLGATFYELLTKQVPIPADQRSVVDRNPKVTSFADLRERFPMNFLSGIDKAMSVDERARFYSAKIWRDYINTMAAAGTLNTSTAPQANSVLNKSIMQPRSPLQVSTAQRAAAPTARPAISPAPRPAASPAPRPAASPAPPRLASPTARPATQKPTLPATHRRPHYAAHKPTQASSSSSVAIPIIIALIAVIAVIWLACK